VYNTHTHAYNRSSTKLTKQQKKPKLFFSFFSLNTSINCASLYFYSFVDVICLFFSIYVCVLVVITFFSLAVYSFFFFNCSSYPCVVLCRKTKKKKRWKHKPYTHTINFFFLKIEVLMTYLLTYNLTDNDKCLHPSCLFFN
jgi:hypothetical protein